MTNTENTIDYSRNNGTERLVVSLNSPTFDLLDYYEDTVTDLERLDILAAMAQHVEEWTERAVAGARKSGATWQEIADYLGMNSKQAAQQRYGR